LALLLVPKIGSNDKYWPSEGLNISLNKTLILRG
jgi:hypothetical protein